MTNYNRSKRQKGFFDLGFSMAVLAIAGIFAYTVTPDHDASVTTQETQIEVVANLGIEAGDIDLH